jgi:hypothetical protein
MSWTEGCRPSLTPYTDNLMQKDSHEAYGTMPDQENAGTGKIPSKDGMNMCPLIIRAELFGPDPLYRPRGEAERHTPRGRLVGLLGSKGEQSISSPWRFLNCYYCSDEIEGSAIIQ